MFNSSDWWALSTSEDEVGYHPVDGWADQHVIANFNNHYDMVCWSASSRYSDTERALRILARSGLTLLKRFPCPRCGERGRCQNLDDSPYAKHVTGLHGTRRMQLINAGVVGWWK